MPASDRPRRSAADEEPEEEERDERKEEGFGKLFFVSSLANEA